MSRQILVIKSDDIDQDELEELKLKFNDSLKDKNKFPIMVIPETADAFLLEFNDVTT